MEKITFTPPGEEPVDFYIIGQTTLNGKSYILVTDAAEGDADAMILRDDSEADEDDALYSVVEDDDELAACAALFGELLGEDDILLEE